MAEESQEKSLSNKVKGIINDLDLTQQEIGSVLEISQSAVSQKIRNCGFDLRELYEISVFYGKDCITPFQQLLPKKIKIDMPSGELSQVEAAIINLVKNKMK